MELEVQRFLRNPDYKGNKDVALHNLNKLYGIEAKLSPIGEPLVILNYCQLDSPKLERLVQECRGLVLDYENNWEIVACPLFRFFNYGEVENVKFDWNNFKALEKADGSLFIVYHYKDSWRINTRNSFGLGLVGESNFTWEQWFYETINQTSLENLDKNCTYCFEFCSLWNKVVRTYKTAQLYLLAHRNNKTLQEFVVETDYSLGVNLPQVYNHKEIFELRGHFDNLADKTFEGFVLVDKDFNRIKLKNPDYVLLHRIKDNGNVVLARNIVPWILKGESPELIAYFPELEQLVNNYALQIDSIFQQTADAWEKYKGCESQKEFALGVCSATELSSILFTARKEKKDFYTVWKESTERLTRFFDEWLDKSPKRDNLEL